MRKAERLFQLLTLLRSRRTVLTAAQIAESLEVSERTVYRDIAALQVSGVPIEGEAGVGYRLRPGFSLPPIMFEQEELEAIELGINMVKAWAGEAMVQAAQSALQKIEAILPEAMHHRHISDEEIIWVPDIHRETASQFSDTIYRCTKSHQKLKLLYADESGNATKRNVLPLGMVYWGKAWTLVAWCEMRNDYRLFRLDRINQLEPLSETFNTSDTLSLKHYFSIQQP